VNSEICEIWDLPHRHIGRRVLVFDRIASTNTRALELAGQPESDGLALLADEQLAGRGQHGRTWQAAPRSSVLLSVLLYPPDHLNRPALLTAWAAVAVCEVVHEMTGVPPRIKWPNDVLLGGRKVCGILIEQSRQGSRTATVAGIGLNVNQREADFAAAGLPEATSLAAMGAASHDTRAVARRLLAVLDAEYGRLVGGDRDALEARWRRHLNLLGEAVLVEGTDGPQEGRLLECALDGLVIERADGSVARLLPEAVLHVRPQPPGHLPKFM
jgi:BirA family biotin operon repressor/biotin-[acetyl-CoA-carboxylase] ligase